MQDRISTYPNRWILTDTATGESQTVDMTRADQPTQVGTALNTANLLSETAAAAIKNAFGGAPDVPSEAFEIMANNFTKITAGTSELLPGTSTLATGTVYLCYE